MPKDSFLSEYTPEESKILSDILSKLRRCINKNYLEQLLNNVEEHFILIRKREDTVAIFCKEILDCLNRTYYIEKYTTQRAEIILQALKGECFRVI